MAAALEPCDAPRCAAPFEGLLAQLREAHQRELQELRAENEALRARVEQLSGEAQPAFQKPDFLREARPEAREKATPAPQPQEPRPGAELDEETAPGLQGLPSVLACPTLSSLEGNDIGRGRADFRVWLMGPSHKRKTAHIEPKDINFHALCLATYPDRQWQELTVHEQVGLIRVALKPAPFLVDPRSPKMKKWDTLIGICLAFVGIITPYEVVFIDKINVVLFAVNRFVDMVFILDLVLQFFLKVEIQRPHRGGSFMLRDRRALCVRYLRSWFFIDLVSVFPFDVCSLLLAETAPVLQRMKVLRCLKLMRLVKMLRMLRASRILDRWQNVFALQFATQKGIKFCVIMALMSHWMACMWGLIGLVLATELCNDQGHFREFQDGELGIHEVSWVTSLYVNGKTSPDTPCSHFAVYMASLHWATMTITSIGYGDIVPVRLEEYIVGIIGMFVGGLLWAYIISSLCSIMSNACPVDKNFEANVDLLNFAMEEACVPHKERPKYLQIFPFREFLREAKAYDRRISFGQVAERFSPMLRKRLMYHVTHEALNSVYYFNDPDAPRRFTQDVASHLAPKFFSRGEPLDSLRRCLCLMDRGTVAHGGLILVPTSVFHEDFIITQSKYQKVIHTISLTYTQVLVLSREEMELILEPYPAFQRKIRRCAAKMAFCRAVRIMLRALKSSGRMASAGTQGGIVSLSQAFDNACGGRGDSGFAPPARLEKFAL